MSLWSASPLKGGRECGRFLKTWKRQMSCTFSESARKRIWETTGQSHLSLWESYGANPPGHHFQAHGGHHTWPSLIAFYDKMSGYVDKERAVGVHESWKKRKDLWRYWHVSKRHIKRQKTYHITFLKPINSLGVFFNAWGNFIDRFHVSEKMGGFSLLNLSFGDEYALGFQFILCFSNQLIAKSS